MKAVKKPAVDFLEMKRSLMWFQLIMVLFVVILTAILVIFKLGSLY